MICSSIFDPCLWCCRPGSRLGGAMLHHAGAASGVRIITVDRPGFGRSPYDPTHSLTCWPDRLGELADRLGVEKFSLLGALRSSGRSSSRIQEVPALTQASGANTAAGAAALLLALVSNPHVAYPIAAPVKMLCPQVHLVAAPLPLLRHASCPVSAS